MDLKYKRFGKNTILVFVGNAGSKIIGLLLLPIYTRFLSTDEVGITDMVGVYASIFLPVISVCVADGMFVFPKDSDKEGKKKYFSSGLFFALLTFSFYSLLFFIIEITSIKIQIHSTFTDYIWWIFIMTVSLFFQSYMQQFCRSIDKMVIFSTTGIVQALLLVTLAFWWLPLYGIKGYFWSLIVASLLSSLYSYIFSGSYKYLSFHSFDRISLKELLSYGLPLIPNSLMWWLVNGINRPLMESNIGLNAIGLFSVAQKFPSFISILFTILSTAWGISMIEEYRKPGFSIFYEKMIRLITIAVVIGGIILSLSSKLLISIFVSDDFFGAWKYIPFLTIAVLFQCISSLVGGIFMAVKTSKYFFYSSIWGASISLVCTYFFIILWGVMGVCIALTLSFFSLLVSRYIYSRRYVSVDFKPFITLFSFFLAQVITVTLDISVIINIVVSLLSIFLILWQNLSLLKSVKQQFKSII